MKESGAGTEPGSELETRNGMLRAEGMKKRCLLGYARKRAEKSCMRQESDAGGSKDSWHSVSGGRRRRAAHRKRKELLETEEYPMGAKSNDVGRLG
jgi:hypothetical protein